MYERQCEWVKPRCEGCGEGQARVCILGSQVSLQHQLHALAPTPPASTHVSLACCAAVVVTGEAASARPPASPALLPFHRAALHPAPQQPRPLQRTHVSVWGWGGKGGGVIFGRGRCGKHPCNHGEEGGGRVGFGEGRGGSSFEVWGTPRGWRGAGWFWGGEGGRSFEVWGTPTMHCGEGGWRGTVGCLGRGGGAGPLRCTMHRGEGGGRGAVGCLGRGGGCIICMFASGAGALVVGVGSYGWPM